MIRTLDEGDLNALIKLREVGFFHQIDSNDTAARNYIKARLPFTTGYFDGKTLASVITLYPFEMNWAGHIVPMAGLAGVMSAPEHLRQGHVRALVLDAFEKLYEEGVAWILEYPFDPAYYARFGYQSVPNGARLELPCKALFSGNPPSAERLSAADIDKLKPIYEQFASAYTFTLLRRSGACDAWTNLLKSPWTSRERTVYLLDDNYCVFDFRYGKKENVLRVHDFAYSSPQGRAKLLQFLGSFQGQADKVKLHLPSDDPLVFDFARYIKPADTILQARLIDAQAALEAGSSPFEGRFNLKLEDGVCPWNSATLKIEIGEGRVSARASSASPDLRMNARTLVLLLSGSLSALDAQNLGLAEGDGAALRALASLAGEQRPFMPSADFF